MTARSRDPKTVAIVKARLEAIWRMDNRTLRAEWRRLYHQEPPGGKRKLWLLGVAYRIQEQAYGGLSAAGKRQLKAIGEGSEAHTGDDAPRSVRLKPGAKLIREWGGECHTVIVLETGFEWRGKRWRSLSAIAREITGARWSGPRFFGLTGSNRTSSDP